MIISTPENTNAGVFSFINNIIGGGEANADVEIEQNTNNSQTITLLEAAINTNPNPTNTVADLSIVDDSVLETPSGPSGTALEVSEKSLNADKVSVYVVRDGDTLSGIATMFGVNANTILWANDLKSSKDLKKGQELVILPISGVKHIVKKGDTLKSIATKYNGDVDEIISFNNLSSNGALVVGVEIIIPNGEATVASSGSSAVSKPQAAGKATGGYFIRPAKGIKTQGLHGKSKSSVDIASTYGTAVYASASGKVIVAKTSGWNGGYGNYIVIEHSNGLQSLYAHLSSVSVSSGEKVEQGTLIGGMGSSGNSTGTHLHFEILGSRNWNPF